MTNSESLHFFVCQMGVGGSRENAGLGHLSGALQVQSSLFNARHCLTATFFIVILTVSLWKEVMGKAQALDSRVQ